MVPGLGPVLIARLVRALGSAEQVLKATPSGLRSVRGIGDTKAKLIEEARGDLDRLAAAEVETIAKAGVHLVGLGDETYPPLLSHIDDPPPVLYVRGTLDWRGLDRAALAIVGSRKCSHYGLEQSKRFASTLAQSGVTIVSGGARGIDTAAHKGALDAGGRTIAVMGCGLARAYPPENEDLFARIAERGCVLSELPFHTPPTAENFPARNRIISGMSHGTLVIEAGHKSGSLITARLAAEDHGREVFAIPGRVDSACSAGSLDLIKTGGAIMATEPADILHVLRDAPTFGVREGAAFGTDDLGTQSSEEDAGRDGEGLFAPVRRTPPGMRPLGPIGPRELLSEPGLDGQMADESADVLAGLERNAASRTGPLATDPIDARILAALDEPMSPDQLGARVEIPVHELRSRLTMLEIQRRVKRVGTHLERVR